MLQRASRTPLLLRQIPIWKDGIAVGFIDLALERAFIYREHAPSEIVDLPEGETLREREARFAMLERLADYDDELMEDLISEIEPPRDRIFDDLSRELKERHVVPVLIGSAERGNGVTRLLKALAARGAGADETRGRLGVSEDGAAARPGHEDAAYGPGRQALRRPRPARRRSMRAIPSSARAAAEARIGCLLTLIGSARPACRGEGRARRVGFGRLEGIATGDRFRGGQGAAGRHRIARAAGTGLCLVAAR